MQWCCLSSLRTIITNNIHEHRHTCSSTSTQRRKKLAEGRINTVMYHHLESLSSSSFDLIPSQCGSLLIRRLHDVCKTIVLAINLMHSLGAKFFCKKKKTPISRTVWWNGSWRVSKHTISAY